MPDHFTRGHPLIGHHLMKRRDTRLATLAFPQNEPMQRAVSGTRTMRDGNALLNERHGVGQRTFNIANPEIQTFTGFDQPPRPSARIVAGDRAFRLAQHAPRDDTVKLNVSRSGESFQHSLRAFGGMSIQGRSMHGLAFSQTEVAKWVNGSSAHLQRIFFIGFRDD
ncbi:MAG: hypothetical protein R3C99_25050 [Pirellulaceae bacterium]